VTGYADPAATLYVAGVLVKVALELSHWDLDRFRHIVILAISDTTMLACAGAEASKIRPTR